MSGLEKFNPRESGLYRLKDFLLRERPSARESLNSSNGSEDSIALDLDQSFAQLIKAHINKRNNNMEDKENLYKSACENTLHASISQKLEQKQAKTETVYSFDDSTIIKDSLSDSDNDSFEELERMCNKTLSDPDNTIHQYLAKYKRSKRSSGVANATSESACLSRLLREIDEQLDGNGADSVEQIQLNDIEEPSGLWESTFGGDITGLVMTPERKIKFQPKTQAIIEEAVHETARKSDTNVSQFFSANDTSYLTIQGEPTFVSAKSEKETLDQAGQDVVSTTLIDLDCTDETENTTESVRGTFKTCVEDLTSDLKETSVKELDDSVELICLDDHEDNAEIGEGIESKPALSDTFYVTPRRNTSQRMSQNLIDLEAPTPKIKLEPVRPKIITDINGDSIILLSDEEDSYDDHNDSESHNTAFSLDLEDSTDLDLSGMQASDQKREFNDTLEEVDYIMKQGMKYLADTNQLPQCLKSYKQKMYSPSPISSPQTPNTVIKKKPVKKIISNEKLKPIDHFKKPLAYTKIPQSKHLAATKKPTHFQHIVSPVGAYIKNTPKIPITTDFKTTQNVFQSKAVRGLDYSMKEATSKKAEHPSKEYFSGLPKKAYISSDVKQVVDQRKPATMPGGEKIHRYLHSSKVPAVIRHEGKIKSNIPSHPQSKFGNKADNSLADLSTISGDISLHILKDAKR